MSSASQTFPRKISRTFIKLERHHGFILALVIIAAYVFFYGHVLYTDKDGALGGLEKVSSTFGNIVAVVIGYYFGQRPVQDIARQTQEVTGQRDMYRKEFNDLYNLIEIRNKEYSDLKSDLESIKRQLGVS